MAAPTPPELLAYALLAVPLLLSLKFLLTLLFPRAQPQPSSGSSSSSARRPPSASAPHTFPDPGPPDSSAPVRRRPFPSIFDAPTVSLSIIVPAYNEQSRLPKMLDEALAVLDARTAASAGKFTWELLVVDDGSRDATSDVAFRYTRARGADRVRVLTLPQNVGKGGAVRAGALAACGELVLFADADGATKFADLARVWDALERRAAARGEKDLAEAMVVAVGSRREADANATRSSVRAFVSAVFAVFLRVVGGVRRVKDTQCGFKMFTRAAARVLFPAQRLERWAFDVELLYMAGVAGIDVVEVPVAWTEVPGSKLSVVKASINMIRDVTRMRWNHATGAWRIDLPRH